MKILTNQKLYIQCNSHQKFQCHSLQKLKQIPKTHWQAQIPDSESNQRGKEQMLFFLSFVVLKIFYRAINQVFILDVKVKLKLPMGTNRTIRDGKGRKE